MHIPILRQDVLTFDLMDPTRSLLSGFLVLLMDFAMAPSSNGSPAAVPVPYLNPH